MKNRIIALLVGIVLFLFFSSMHAQITFERWYNRNQIDFGVSVDQTKDEGYYVAGTTGALGGPWDYYLIKTDSLGDTIWTRTYSCFDSEFAYSGTKTSDEGYAIIGYTLSPGRNQADIYLVRVDSMGDTLWTYIHEDTSWDMGFSITETSDKGYIITGSHDYSDVSDVALIKIDSLGNYEWMRTYGGADYDAGYSVIQTFDGGYLVGGYTMSYGSGYGDVLLIRTNSVGDTLWTKIYGNIYRDICYSIQQTSDGGYIATGSKYNDHSLAYDVWLIKTDENGDSLWSKTYGRFGQEYGRSVQQTTDKGFIVGGYVRENSGDRNVYLIRTDSLGDTLWTRFYGGINHDSCNCVKQTIDGGFIVTGQTNSYGPGIGNVYLIKTDAYGNVAGIQEQPDKRPEIRDFAISCHPNPYSTSTTISFERLSEHQSASESELQIFDVSGRKVREISLLPFNFSLEGTWDGRDEVGNVVSPGIYFLKLNGKPVGKVVKVK